MEFIFSQVDDPMEFNSHALVASQWVQGRKAWLANLSRENEPLNLYVTGLTPLIIEFLSQWNYLQTIALSPLPVLKLMHYDRDSESYRPQSVIVQKWS